MTLGISIHPLDRILSALDELTDDSPDLEPAVDFFAELLPVMYEARPSLGGLSMDVEAAQDKLGQGIPLLWGELNPTHGSGMEPDTDLFTTLCRLAADGGNQGGEVLMLAWLEGELDLKAMLARALVLDRAGLTELARSWHVDLHLLETVSRFMLTPITWAYAAAVGQALDFSTWYGGYCPACGAWPVLGELRGRDKTRYLRCGRCGMGWKFRRQQCLWCDNANQKELSFLFDPDDPTWRVDVCDYCQGYIKTLITFDSLEAEMLLVHDLETMFMDHMAASKGYKRPHKQPLG